MVAASMLHPAAAFSCRCRELTSPLHGSNTRRTRCAPLELYFFKGVLMTTSDRRTFLKMIGAPALAAAVPVDLSRALAIPAHNRTGSLDAVEHVVFLMQENRSFDHYF